MNSVNKQLFEQGYVVIEDILSKNKLSEVRARISTLFEEEGDQAGTEFKIERGARRLANLANKGLIFLELIKHEKVLDLVRQVLGNSFKLSSLNARSALPQNNTRQPLHCDMGAIPDERGFWVCNCVWLLDDFKENNGALRVVPGTHRSGVLPQDSMENPNQTHSGEILVTAKSGSVIVLNAHLWHGGLENQTYECRTAIHAFYCRSDKPQQQVQSRMLDESLQAQLSPALRKLLALDEVEAEGLHRQTTKRSGFLD